MLEGVLEKKDFKISENPTELVLILFCLRRKPSEIGIGKEGVVNSENFGIYDNITDFVLFATHLCSEISSFGLQQTQ